MDVLVERVDEDPERQVELELTGSPREDEAPACVGPGSELGEEARLADSGLADQLERRGLSPSDLREEAAMNAFFIVPTNWKQAAGELFMTHPPLQKRLERLGQIAQEMGRPVPA